MVAIRCTQLQYLYLTQLEDGWYFGNLNGRHGVFHGNFVDLQDVPEPTSNTPVTSAGMLHYGQTLAICSTCIIFLCSSGS